MWSRCSSSFCPPSPRPTVRDDPLRRWPSRTESRSDFNILRSSNGPMVTQRRQTQPWSSRARNDRVSTSPYLRCPAPSNRIATGTRTDSGEERFFLALEVCAGTQPTHSECFGIQPDECVRSCLGLRGQLLVGEVGHQHVAETVPRVGGARRGEQR